MTMKRAQHLTGYEIGAFRANSERGRSSSLGLTVLAEARHVTERLALKALIKAIYRLHCGYPIQLLFATTLHRSNQSLCASLFRERSSAKRARTPMDKRSRLAGSGASTSMSSRLSVKES